MYVSISICISIDTDRERERLIDFKELAYSVVGTGKSEICRAGAQAGNSGRSSCSSPKEEFLLFQVNLRFLLPQIG